MDIKEQESNLESLKSFDESLDLNQVRLDLESTLLDDLDQNNGVPTLTMREISEFFPNTDVNYLKAMKNNIVNNNESLKKKDLSLTSLSSSNIVETSELETHSTSESSFTQESVSHKSDSYNSEWSSSESSESDDSSVSLETTEVSEETTEVSEETTELTDPTDPPFTKKEINRAQTYIDNNWAPDTRTGEDRDKLFNIEAYNYLKKIKDDKEAEEKRIADEKLESEFPTLDLNVEELKIGIIKSEATGYLKGSPDKLSDEDYSLKNADGDSSAIGPYQFIYSQFRDILKTEFNVNSREDFIGNKEAQEGLWNYMMEDKPGRYPFMAKSLYKNFPEQVKELNVSFRDLIALEHFVGHPELRSLFTKMKNDDKFGVDEFMEFSPGGEGVKNKTLGGYLDKAFKIEEDEETGFNIENPLESPYLTAGGDEQVQTEVSAALSEEDDDVVLSYSQWKASQVQVNVVENADLESQYIQYYKDKTGKDGYFDDGVFNYEKKSYKEVVPGSEMLSPETYESGTKQEFIFKGTDNYIKEIDNAINTLNLYAKRPVGSLLVDNTEVTQESVDLVERKKRSFEVLKEVAENPLFKQLNQDKYKNHTEFISDLNDVLTFNEFMGLALYNPDEINLNTIHKFSKAEGGVEGQYVWDGFDEDAITKTGAWSETEDGQFTAAIDVRIGAEGLDVLKYYDAYKEYYQSITGRSGYFNQNGEFIPRAFSTDLPHAKERERNLFWESKGENLQILEQIFDDKPFFMMQFDLYQQSYNDFPGYSHINEQEYSEDLTLNYILPKNLQDIPPGSTYVFQDMVGQQLISSVGYNKAPIDVDGIIQEISGGDIWVPTSERGYSEAGDMSNYGMGSDSYEIVIGNIIYDATGDGDYGKDAKNTKGVEFILKKREGSNVDFPEAGISLMEFKYPIHLLDNSEMNILKGIAIEANARGYELDRGRIEALMDLKKSHYNAELEGYYEAIFRSIPNKYLKYKQEFDYDVIRDDVLEYKKEFVKDLIERNIYLPGYIHGSNFEDYITDRIYSDLKKEFIEEIYPDIEDMMDDSDLKSTYYTMPHIAKKRGHDVYQSEDVGGTIIPGVLVLAERSDIDMFRQAINKEFRKNKYDWMGQSDKTYLGELLVDRFRTGQKTYKNAQETNEINWITKHNEKAQEHNNSLESENIEDISMEFHLPETITVTVKEEVDKMTEEGLLAEEINDIIEAKYGLDYNLATGGYDFTDKYKSKYNQMYEETNAKSMASYKKAHPDQKYLLTEAFEGTIIGQIYNGWTGGQWNPDYGVEYSGWDRGVISVGSIVLDPTMYVGGYGINLASKSLMANRSANLYRSANAYQKTLMHSGIAQNEAKMIASTQLANNLTKTRRAIGTGSGALNLSAYTQTHYAATSYTENFEDYELNEQLKIGWENAILGGSLFWMGELSQMAKSRLSQMYGKESKVVNMLENSGKIIDGKQSLKTGDLIKHTMPELTWKQSFTYGGSKLGIDVTAFTLEASAFMAMHYNPELSLQENFLEQVYFLGGLKGTMLPFKLAKSNRQNPKTSADFQVDAPGSKKTNLNYINEQLGKNFKNDKELYNYIHNTTQKAGFNKDGSRKGTEAELKELVTMMEKLPQEVMWKYWDANNFSMDVNLLDAVTAHHYYDTETNNLISYNHGGQVTQVRNFSEITDGGSKSLSSVNNGKPPTMEQVRDYVLEKGNQTSKLIHDYYDKNGNFSNVMTEALNKKGISKEQYNDWKEGKVKEADVKIEYEINETIDYIWRTANAEQRQMIENHNTSVVKNAVNNLLLRGNENPSALAIRKECMVIENKLADLEIKRNEYKAMKLIEEKKNSEELHNNRNKNIHKDNNTGEYTQQPTQNSSPVKTDVKGENTINLGKTGVKDIKDIQSEVIVALKNKKELTPDLESKIKETKDFQEIVDLVTKETNIDAIEYKTTKNLINEQITNKPDNTIIITNPELENKVKDRKNLDKEVVTENNIKDIQSSAENSTEVQVFKDIETIKKQTGAEVTVHNSKESFLEVLEKEGKTVESNRYKAEAYVDKDGNIHINRNGLTEGTSAFHEYGHLFFEALKKKDKNKYDKLMEDMNTLMEENINLINIKDIVEAKDKTGQDIYKGVEKSEEAIIRLAEAIRNGYIKPSDLKGNKFLNKIKVKINNILESRGYESGYFKTNSEALEFVERWVKEFETSKASEIGAEVGKIKTETEGQLKVSWKYGEEGVEQNWRMQESKEVLSKLETSNSEINKGEVSLSGTFEQGYQSLWGPNTKDLRGTEAYRKEGRGKEFVEYTLEDGTKVFGLMEKNHQDGAGRRGYFSVEISYDKNSNVTLNDVKSVLEQKMNIVNKAISFEGKLSDYTSSLKEIKTKDIQGETKTLETLVFELEDLKKRGADQSLIDAKQKEVNSARIKYSQEMVEMEKSLEPKTEVKTEVTTEVGSQEVFNASKELLNKIDLKQTREVEKDGVTFTEQIYNKETSKLVDKLKYVEFKNNPELIEKYNEIALKISEGTATTKEINDAYNTINALEKAETINQKIDNSIEKHGGRFRFILFGPRLERARRLGKIGGIEIESKRLLERDLNTRNLSMIEDYFMLEKDGVLTKNIIGPIQKAHVGYEVMTRDLLKEWSDGTVFFMKDKTPGGRIRRRKSMTKLGMILAQKERNGIDGLNVINEILTGKDKNGKFTDSYSQAEVERIKRLYKKLPKTKDGRIDVEAAIAGLSKTERQVLDTWTTMSENLNEKQKYANEINGSDFNEIKDYFPHINRRKYVTKKDGTEVLLSEHQHLNVSGTEFVEGIYNQKVLSDRGKDRTAIGVIPIEFNLDKIMNNWIMETSRDYIYSEPIQRGNVLMDYMKDNNPNANSRLAINAIQNRIKESLRMELHTKNGWFSRNVGQPLYSISYSNSLTTLRRLTFVEPTAETFRIFTSRPVEEWGSMFYQMIDGSNRRMHNMFSLGNRLYDTPVSTPLKLQKLTGSLAQIKSNRLGMEYQLESGGKHNNTFQNLNNYFLGMTDRLHVNLVWMPKFKSEFKKIAGEKFNDKLFNEANNSYYNKHKRLIEEASMIADRELAKWKNESAKGGKRSEIRLPISTMDAKSEWAPVMTYMSNFGAQEIAMFQRGLKNILRGGSAKERLQGLQESLSIGSSGVIYGVASAVTYGYTNYLYQRQAFENQLNDPKFGDQLDYIKGQIAQLDADWQGQLDNLLSVDHFYQQSITNAMFLTNSKYSNVVKATMASSVGLIDRWLGPDNKNFVNAGGEPSIYEAYSTEAKHWMSSITYARSPESVGDVAELILPQMDAFMDLFYERAPKEYWDYMDSGIYVPDKHEEFREEINAMTWYTNVLKMLQYAPLKGKLVGSQPVPFIKDIEMMLRTWDKAYGVDVQEYQKFLDAAQDNELITQSTVGEPVGQSDVGEPVGQSSVGEPESIMRKSLPDEGFDPDIAGAVQNFEYWMYTEEELKKMWPKEDLMMMLPRSLWLEFVANEENIPFSWTQD
tara:strand:- start:5571 stop:15974 length:10404 start_codon:yes stop_codon:yes gene_type:complete